MNASAPVNKDHPLMKAWEDYKATPEYENTKKWALSPRDTDGSLWAAFLQGWEAAGGQRDYQGRDESKSDSHRPQPRYRHVKTGGVYRLLWCNVFLEWAPGKPHALYQSEETAQLWLRPETEFFDGRFEEEPESPPKSEFKTGPSEGGK